MVAPNRKKIQVFGFLGISFSLFVCSLWLININNNKTISKTIPEDLLLANSPIENKSINSEESQDITLLDNRATVADTVNVDIASELKNTDNNNELKDFLEKTEVDSLVTETQPQIANEVNKLDVQTDPAKSYYDRGLVYSIYQRYPEAIASYNRALNLNPQLTLGYYHRGIAREKLGDLTKAIQDFQKAQFLAKKQNDPTALEMAKQKLDYLVK